MTAPPTCPPEVAEFARQTVAYVERALGVRLSYDSETLPVLDHYLRQVAGAADPTIDLVAQTAGAYFGEVVRHHLGGRWEAGADPDRWRVVLPTALAFAPVRLARAAVLRSGTAEADLDVPSVIRPLIESTLEGMADVSEEIYYSLCGRLDTLEHLHETVAAAAATRLTAEAAAEPDA
jgi:hypothetical protein